MIGGDEIQVHKVYYLKEICQILSWCVFMWGGGHVLQCLHGIGYDE